MNHPEIDLNQLQKTATVNRQVINRLKERVGILENALGLVCGDPQMQWLYRNRSERMDAMVALFPKGRADFHLARYEFAAERVAGLAVVDIACGTGYGCRLLVENGQAAMATGIDICSEAIDYARNRHGMENTCFHCRDGCDTGLEDGSQDIVVSFETIEHVTDDRKLLKEFHRVLRPGGTLICSTPNQWPLDIAPHHLRVYDRESFVEALNGYFRVDEMFNQNSGTDFRYNHGQASGIIRTTDANQHLAECLIAVATRNPD